MFCKHYKFRGKYPSTAQWSLYVPPSGHYLYRQFNIQQFYVLLTQLYLCLLCGSENKQQLFPYTTFIDWFLEPTFVLLEPSGYYMYRQFNIQQFYVLLTQLYLCLLCGSEDKQRLFPYTTFIDWFLEPTFVLLEPSGHYMYRQFNIQQFYVLLTQMYLCLLCGSEDKQRLFPYTTFIDWFLEPTFVLLEPSG